MAGDWIKVEAVTPDKPEIYRIAEMLNLAPEYVLGSLIRVWIWADQQSVSGNVVSVTEKTLDRISGLAGLATSMRDVGWLEGKDGSITIPNFDRHNGKTAKNRALTNERVKRLRNPFTVTESLPEKRREENIKPSTKAGASPAGSRLSLEALPDDWKAFCNEARPDLDPTAVFADFHDYWIAKPGKDGRKLSWLATWRKWVRNTKAMPKANGNGQWQFSDQGVMAKAAELGMSAKPGESFRDLKARIVERLGA